jgi:hypothetical protein
LLKIPYNIIDGYEVRPYKGCFQSSGINKEACNSLIYGCITIGLRIAGLWPGQWPEDILLSAEELAKRNKNVRILRNPTNYNDFVLMDHSECYIQEFRELVSGFLTSIGSLVLEN